MARVKRGVAAHRRHRSVLKQVKGHRGTRNRLYKRAHESLMHALQYAYRDRRNRKRAMRRLWIQRINAASRLNGMPYSHLVHGLTLAGVEVDRKILADLAVRDEEGFAAVVQVAKSSLPSAQA
ncbi:MAG TPA: 50S ribosomal protein L20 [Thermomicrobiales bacterium]|nr:50S ribosomal protein L20 [Thermomicrobiales bacterium]